MSYCDYNATRRPEKVNTAMYVCFPKNSRTPSTDNRTEPPKPMDGQQLKLTNLSGGAGETARRRQCPNPRQSIQSHSEIFSPRTRINPQESVFVISCSASGFQQCGACSCIARRSDAAPSSRCCWDHCRLEPPPPCLNRSTGFLAPPSFTRALYTLSHNWCVHHWVLSRRGPRNVIVRSFSAPYILFSMPFIC